MTTQAHNSGPLILVIDYGASNLRSVQKAFAKLGHDARVSSNPADLSSADALILPGQGAAPPTMQGLKDRGLLDPMLAEMSGGKPFLGVCMGLQVLFDFSAEGQQDCLGVFSGNVQRLPDTVKQPHIGWNQVDQCRSSLLFEGISDRSYFYFVHSYHPVPQDPNLTLATTDYGLTFCCAATRDNVVATLFHPEKSGALGLKLYENFIKHWVLHQRWK